MKETWEKWVRCGRWKYQVTCGVESGGVVVDHPIVPGLRSS